jgi:hypothetical protein
MASLSMQLMPELTKEMLAAATNKDCEVQENR